MRNTETALILDRYEPIETAGEGGFGKVIHAYDTRLKREVAIKVVDGVRHAQQATDLKEAVPGLAEARAAGKLANANIVTIYDCDVSEDKAYVIEEYVEGITLTTLLRRFPDEINLDVIAHIFKSVATAVMAAHKENVLHLDIKPDNILIGRGGEVKVADFGLATLMDLNGEGSASAGTLGYMPLEQMHHVALDVRADEWSLAMVTYEMLVGTNPFAEAKTVQDAENRMLNGELVVPSACWAELTDESDDAIFKALNVNRDARYASVRQFMTAFRTHLGNASEGKKQLAVLVNGNDEKLVDTSTIASPEPRVPLQFIETETPVIDSLNNKGLDVVFKTIASIAAAVMVIFATSNLSFPVTEAESFLNSQPVVTGAVAIVAAIIAWILPRYGVLIPFIALEAMFNLSSAWALMAVYAIAFLLWWSFLGKSSDRNSACFLLAALAGAFGLTPIAVVLAAAIARKMSDAALETSMIFLQAIIFASFGSCSLFTWDIMANFVILPDETGKITAVMGDNFLRVFTDPNTWIVAAAWLLAACIFAICCDRKAKTLHILGALVAGAILIMSAFVQWPLFFAVENVDAYKALSVVVADALAICLAATGFTATARKDPYAF